MNKVAVLTISSHNYMPYGLTCLTTAKHYNQEYDVYYVIADCYNGDLYKKYEKDIVFVSLQDLNYSDEEIVNLTFKYNIIEFNTCIKPQAILYLLNKGYQTVIYLDPDIECYNSFEQLLLDTKNQSIIVTPHKMTEKENPLIEDKQFLNNGIYNLGFLAINNKVESRKFLDWWDKKLRKECYIHYEEGLATDQIWVVLASTIFEGFCVYKNEGVNVAYWNIHERKIEKMNNNYFVNNLPLVFFHFSSLSLTCNQSFLKSIDDIQPGFKNFYNEHVKKVKCFDFDLFCNIPYSFSTYSDGSIIPKGHRWLYGYSLYLQERFKNPFLCDLRESFKKSIKSRRLIKYMHPKDSKENILLFFIRIFGLDRTVRTMGFITIVKHVSRMFDKKT